MKLVIIEGIGKKETIEKYLGTGYKVFATKGHIRDLPPKSLAVDVKNNFLPKYEPMPDKKDIIKKMQSEAEGAQEVYLATDPDREGEAISWHVATLLKIPPEKKARIVFNEISKKAVTAALSSPRAIDLDLVDAQQARRVLDRLVGYKVSPIICKRLGGSQSAGRVQSVTLRLVVERDREIAAFKPEEYWNFFSVLNKNGIDFKAALALKNDKKYKIHTAQEVEEVKKELDGRPYIVKSVKKAVVQSKAPPPFVTSSMQQDALNKLGMSLKQTSMAAQNLYEGVDIGGEGKVALVTYIRTDSTRVSDDAMAEAREFIKQNYGDKYVPEKPNFYAAKKNTQDAHEAIRPITLSRTPESLKKTLAPNLYKLYKLIYERFLASQMAPAQYDSLTVDIQNGIYGFKVTGKTLLFAGFTAVYKAYEEEKEEENGISKLPALIEDETLKFIEYKYEQKFTKPPAHYTEASLVKTMEEKGIGRPATYTPTVALLVSCEYIVKEGKFIVSTPLGANVTDMLIKYFSDIMDVQFTAEMEERLDKIEEGGKKWQSVVSEFYKDFEKQLFSAYEDKPPEEESEYACPVCGKKMFYRTGRFGKFLGCTGYPSCKQTLQIDEEGKPLPPKTEEVTNEICKLCGKPMALKNGRFGQFLGCTGYPKCKNIVNLEQNGNGNGTVPQENGVKEDFGRCPLCSKPLVKRRGKTVFFGCSGYPECKFISSNKVVEGKCPDCEAHLVQKEYRGEPHVLCGKACGYKQKIESENAANG